MLMAALYALGMMDLLWMVLITVIVVSERLAPRPAAITRTTAALLVALGADVAGAPRDVPGLTLYSARTTTQMQATINARPLLCSLLWVGRGQGSLPVTADRLR